MEQAVKEGYKLIESIKKQLEDYQSKYQGYELLILTTNEMLNLSDDIPFEKQYLNTINNAVKFDYERLYMGITKRRGTGFLSMDYDDSKYQETIDQVLGV